MNQINTSKGELNVSPPTLNPVKLNNFFADLEPNTVKKLPISCVNFLSNTLGYRTSQPEPTFKTAETKLKLKILLMYTALRHRMVAFMWPYNRTTYNYKRLRTSDQSVCIMYKVIVM